MQAIPIQPFINLLQKAGSYIEEPLASLMITVPPYSAKPLPNHINLSRFKPKPSLHNPKRPSIQHRLIVTMVSSKAIQLPPGRNLNSSKTTEFTVITDTLSSSLTQAAQRQSFHSQTPTMKSFTAYTQTQVPKMSSYYATATWPTTQCVNSPSSPPPSPALASPHSVSTIPWPIEAKANAKAPSLWATTNQK